MLSTTTTNTWRCANAWTRQMEPTWNRCKRLVLRDWCFVVSSPGQPTRQQSFGRSWQRCEYVCNEWCTIDLVDFKNNKLFSMQPYKACHEAMDVWLENEVTVVIYLPKTSWNRIQSVAWTLERLVPIEVGEHDWPSKMATPSCSTHMHRCLFCATRWLSKMVNIL